MRGQQAVSLLLRGALPTRINRADLKVFVKPGDYKVAAKDFKSVFPTRVKDLKPGIEGVCYYQCFNSFTPVFLMWTLPPLILVRTIVPNRGLSQNQTRMTNTVGPVETTQYEPSHQDLHGCKKCFRLQDWKSKLSALSLLLLQANNDGIIIWSSYLNNLPQV